MPSVSYSETSSYLMCKRKHYYGYTKSLTKVYSSDALQTGTAGHRVFEAFYRAILLSGDTRREQLKGFDTALSMAEAEYAAVVKEGYRDNPKKPPLDEILFQHYFPNEHIVKAGYLIQAVEKEFVLKLEDSEIETPFVVDLIAVDPTGKTIIIDHKFVYDFYSYEECQLQPQIPLYIGALRGMGFKIDGGAYNMLRNRKIKAPKLEQMIQFLPFPVNATRVVRTFEDQIDTAEEIQAIKLLSPEEQDRKAHRVSTKMVCRSCDFRDLCITELNGGNVQLAMKDYKIRERRSFAAATEENDDAEI